MAYPKEVYIYGQKCPVFSGPGIIMELGLQARARNLQKAFIVTDGGVVKAGILTKLERSLKRAGVDSIVFDEINVDPLDTIVFKAAELCKQSGADFIIGLGGGSSLDAAKSIGILQTNPMPLSQYYGVFAPNPTIPIWEVPTTSGTGSECTSYSVISDTTTNTKKVPLQNADLAFCDGELTIGLPPQLTAATAMDAFSHAAECITGLIQNPHTDALCSYGIRQIMTWAPVCMKEPENIEARQNMMDAANLIGIGFGEMGCHLGHAIGQCMGAAFHTTHGISCAWALPATMEYAAIANPDKVKIVADFMGLTYDPDITAEGIGKLVSDGISDFMYNTLGLQPMSEYGITREALIGIADIVMEDNCWPVIPSPLTKAELEELLGTVYDSYKG